MESEAVREISKAATSDIAVESFPAREAARAAIPSLRAAESTARTATERLATSVSAPESVTATDPARIGLGSLRAALSDAVLGVSPPPGSGSIATRPETIAEDTDAVAAVAV
jgi:expansin (peptidoglycan-binding protein)